MTLITHNRLLEVLDYNPLTGLFIWKMCLSRRIHIGDIAGTKSLAKDGKIYYKIKIDGIFYNAHNLAWFYVNKEWPINIIDHIKGNSNAISNLREATYTQNAGNKDISKNKKHGFKGVSSSRYQFCARICVKGKNKIIGYFSSALEAAKAYDQEAINVFGDFALTNKKLGLY